MRKGARNKNKNAFELMISGVQNKKDNMYGIYTMGCGNPPACSTDCKNCNDPGCKRCQH
jgi:hypothetical protein